MYCSGFRKGDLQSDGFVQFTLLATEADLRPDLICLCSVIGEGENDIALLMERK